MFDLWLAERAGGVLALPDKPFLASFATGLTGSALLFTGRARDDGDHGLFVQPAF